VLNILFQSLLLRLPSRRRSRIPLGFLQLPLQQGNLLIQFRLGTLCLLPHPLQIHRLCGRAPRLCFQLLNYLPVLLQLGPRIRNRLVQSPLPSRRNLFILLNLPIQLFRQILLFLVGRLELILQVLQLDGIDAIVLLEDLLIARLPPFVVLCQ
jgi:hypothetical protein